MQRDAVCYIIEHFRRNKYAHATGVFPYMFKESWASINFGILDFKRNPKMAYLGLMKSMAPTIVSIDWDKTKYKPGERFKTPLYLINDRDNELKGTLVYWKVFKLEDENRKPLTSGSFKKDIPRDSSIIGGNAEFTIPKDAKPGDKWAITVELKDKDGNLISDNDLVFGVSSKGKLIKYEPVHLEYPNAG
jgi:beta-mannosidase